MSILDAFFTVAPPFAIFSMLFASFAISYAKRRGIYVGEEGEARRDAVNRKYGTNKGAAVIGGFFVLLWLVTVAALVEQWGAILFTWIVSALLIIPYFTVCAAVIMLYMFAVHGYAKAKGG